MLLGVAPRVNASEPELRLDEKAAAYLLTLRAPAASQLLWVDPLSFRTRRSERSAPGAYRLFFDDFQPAAGTQFPREVRLEVPSAQLELRLRYRDVAFNEPPEPELFDPAPPPDVRVIEVDAEGNPRPPEGPPGA